MAANVEVLFCDLCNESVPQTDLDTGRALRWKGRVVGACCAGVLRPAEKAERPERLDRADSRPTSTVGGLVAGVVVLAGVAAAAAFLDWRLSQEVSALASRLVGVEDRGRTAVERLAAMEDAVAKSAARFTLEPLTTRIDGLEGRVDHARSSSEVRAARLDEALGALSDRTRASLADLAEGLAAVRGGVESLAAEVAVLRAAPPVVVKSAEPATGPAVSSASAPAATGAAKLSSELQHHVLALGDEDPGTRFSAVHNLLRSRNVLVLPALLPMAKDTNVFVRRLTVEGLKDFRRPEVVETLMVALADPESLVRLTAHASLRALTGQRFEFDDGSTSSRAASQRRWTEWWEKNKATFSF